MHRHHIIPRHMGGTDDPSNLVEVTIEQHAELHFALYLEHGNWQDWLAANGLAGLVSHEETARQATSLANKGRIPWNKGKNTGPNLVVSEANKRRVWSEESKEKCKEAGRKNKGNKRPDLREYAKKHGAENAARRKRDSNGRFT